MIFKKIHLITTIDFFFAFDIRLPIPDANLSSMYFFEIKSLANLYYVKFLFI